jgi:hypothetical protein
MADRVRITSSRRGASRPSDRSVGRELREETGLGEVYLRGLMSAQLRLSATVLAVGAVLLGGLPLVFALAPSTRDVAIAGIPLAWVVLGVAVYPAALVTARFYVRASERIEREFHDVSEPPDPPDPPDPSEPAGVAP